MQVMAKFQNLFTGQPVAAADIAGGGVHQVVRLLSGGVTPEIVHKNPHNVVQRFWQAEPARDVGRNQYVGGGKSTKCNTFQ